MPLTSAFTVNLSAWLWANRLCSVDFHFLKSILLVLWWSLNKIVRVKSLTQGLVQSKHLVKIVIFGGVN
jgi:hypothetical protein